MASKYGLTEYGFNLPSYQDLVDETKTTFKNEFGDNFNTETNSVADKIISILAEREYQLYLLGASVFSAQTRTGAEGIYLDDLFGKMGHYRKGKTKSTGPVIMTVDSSVPYNMVYDNAVYTVDSDYALANDIQVAGNIIAHKIVGKDLRIGSYSFSIQNQTDGSTQALQVNIAANTGAPVIAAFGAIKDFVVANTTPSNADRILVDSTEETLYIGYNTSKELIGLISRVDFRSSPLVGDKSILMDVIAKEAGYQQREENSIHSISPTPSGYVTIQNLEAFAPGSEVETDNEYKLRVALLQAGEGGKATRPAIIAALKRDVEGLEKVRIFANNTDKTNALGIPPYKFMVVCFGGSTDQISKVLYDTIALSNVTYGTSYADIATEDEQTERVYHTKATVRHLALRVQYKGRTLTPLEEKNIRDKILELVEAAQIADTLYNVQLVGTVLNSTSSNRFTQVSVEVKNRDDADSTYTKNDIVAGMIEVFSLSADNIYFNQSL